MLSLQCKVSSPQPKEKHPFFWVSESNQNDVHASEDQERIIDDFCALICQTAANPNAEAQLKALIDRDPEWLNRGIGRVSGLTPLMLAISRNRHDLVKVILECGQLDLSVKSAKGATVIEIAIFYRQFDIAFDLLYRLNFLSHDKLKYKIELLCDAVYLVFQEKIENEYFLQKDLLESCFDWNELRKEIADVLFLSAYTKMSFRKDRCQITRRESEIDDLLIYSKRKSQPVLSGALKRIKPFQFLIQFSKKTFSISHSEIYVLLSDKSPIYKKSGFLDNLRSDDYFLYSKIPKKISKDVKQIYIKKNLGLNLKIFLHGPWLFQNDYSFKNKIVESILNTFFLLKCHKFDLKLENMSIRLEEENQEKIPKISFLDTIDPMYTKKCIPASFFVKYQLDLSEAILSHKMTPYVQIVTACLSVYSHRHIMEASKTRVLKSIAHLKQLLMQMKIDPVAQQLLLEAIELFEPHQGVS